MMKKTLKKWPFLAMALVLAAGLATGCGSKNNPPAATGASSQAGADKTADGGKTPGGDNTDAFSLATVSEGGGDRMLTSWQNKTLQSDLLFRTLFLADAGLTNVTPDLAESYKISDDGLTYTIVMKDGPKWSDGQPITAQDVAFSIKDNLKAAVSNGIYTSAFTQIKGAKEWKEGAADLEGLKVDGKTITITLVEPYASFIPVLAQFDILPQHILKDVNPLELHNNDYWIKPVSSGMFMVDQVSPGNFYTMVPNPYWDGPAPKIKKVINYWVNNYITAAQAGKLDYFSTNKTDEINEIGKLPNMQKYPIDILFYRYFIANIKGTDGHVNPVMQNPKVREAILYAIDRKTLAKSMFPGLATVVNSGIPSSYPENNGVDFPYDPEKAKELLKEAGYDFNHTFKLLYYYTDQSSVDFMDAVAYYLQQVGMKVETVQSQQGTTDLYKTRNYDIAYKGLSAFTLGEWYGEYQSNNANFKNIFGGDTQFDSLINQLGSVTDPAKRSDVLKQLEAKEQKVLYKLPLYTMSNIIFVNKAHVKLPDGIQFCNPWYKCNLNFENWELVH